MNKISDVMKTIEEMRKVYPFENENSMIEITDDIVTREKGVIKIQTIDKESGTVVLLSKKINRDHSERD